MMRVRVFGDKALIRALHRAARDMEQLEQPTRAAAREVARSAARRAPRRTGRLAATMTSTVSGGTAVISNRTRYAAYQEYGTSVMRAQPYLRPALYSAPIASFYESHAETVVARL